MSGYYIQPIQRIFLNLSGGTVTGATQFTENLSAATIFSGSTDLSEYFDALQAQISGNASDKYDKSGGTISGDVIITGDLSVLGSATTFNTETVQSEDNNIELNIGGNHISAVGGGITVISGQTDGSSSFLSTNSDGIWCIEPGLKTPNLNANNQFFVNASGVTSTTPLVYSKTLPSGQTMFVGDDQQAVVFGDYTIDGNLIVSGTGEFIVITGQENKLATFDSGGIVTDTDIDVVGGNSLNVSNNISGGTYYSGSTPLELIIEQRANANQTFVQDGSNTFTGGTEDRPTVNITGGTFDNISVSGDTFIENLNANNRFFVNASGVTSTTPLVYNKTLPSGQTMFVGNDQQAVVFGDYTIDGNLVVSGTGEFLIITGQENKLATFDSDGIVTDTDIDVVGGNNLSVPNNISGGTYYSGSTPLELIIEQRANANQTFVQDGSNTFTGGTEDRPTVNITGGTFDNLTVSGDTFLDKLNVDNRFFVNASGVTSTTPLVYNKTLPSGQTMFVGDGQQAVVFGDYTIDGDLVVSGTGEFIVISGQENKLATFDSDGIVTDTGIDVVGGNSLNVPGNISGNSYYQGVEEVRPSVFKTTAPVLTGNTWVRTTDYEMFVFDVSRGKWLGVKEERIGGSRNSANVTNQFLRHYDGAAYNLVPFPLPYDATIVGITANGRFSQTWSAQINSGSTLLSDVITTLSVVSSTDAENMNLNIDIDSGSTLGISLTGSSIDYPRVDLYIKRRGI